MATTKELVDALLSTDLVLLAAALREMRETVNAINAIDVEQLERVGTAARDTIAVMKELHDIPV